MPAWLELLTKSVFVRNVAKLSSARFVAMFIALAATPIIARLFDPQHFGAAATFFAYSTVAGALFPLSYHRAVIFPKDDQTARQMLTLSIIIGGIVTLAVYVALALAASSGVQVTEFAGLGVIVWLLPLGAWLASFSDTFGNLCIRRQDISAMAKADVAQQLVTSGARIAWGFLLATSVAGLVLGQMLGVVVGMLICLVRCLPWLRTVKTSVTLSGLFSLASEYRDYPLFRLPANLSFIASRQLPVIALGLMFPPAIVGFYAMANRAANMPLQAASQAISNVLMGSTMAMRHRQKAIGKKVLRVVVVLAAIGLPVFAGVYILGEELLTWFLGERWRTAGRITEMLAPYLFMVWVSSFSPTVLESLRLNKLRLMLNFGNLAIRALVFLACGIAGFGIIETLAAFVVVSSMYQVLIILISARMVVIHDRSLSSTEGHVGNPGQSEI